MTARTSTSPPAFDVIEVRIDDIDVGDRIRAIQPTALHALKSSIAEIGLLNPVIIHPSPGTDMEGSQSPWGLISGAHRLAACRELGHTTIAAQVMDVDALRRRIAECDENLCVARLGPAEQAIFTAARKEAYEALHPETRHGATGVGRTKSRHDGDSSRFTVDTASRTRRSERAVQRDAMRGSKIDPEILRDIRATELDKGAVLDALAALPRDEQGLKLAELRAKSDVRRERLVQAVTSEIAKDGEASPAAEWLFARLGLHEADEFLRLLETEDLSVFFNRLSHLVQRDTVDGNNAMKMAEAIPLVNEPTSDPVETISDATIPLQIPDPGEQIIEVVGGDLGPMISPPYTPFPSHPMLRPSHWIDPDDHPQDGEQCRDCRGTKWWSPISGRPGWFCAGCFVPEAIHKRSALSCSTALPSAQAA